MLLSLAFPYALFSIGRSYFAAPASERPALRQRVLTSINLYVLFTLPAAHLGVISIEYTSGLDVSPWYMWALFLSPVGLLLVW